MKGFYKGIIPTTAKAVVATAITFAAYEVTDWTELFNSCLHYLILYYYTIRLNFYLLPIT